jgi:hypothetical protein
MKTEVIPLGFELPYSTDHSTTGNIYMLNAYQLILLINLSESNNKGDKTRLNTVKKMWEQMWEQM